MPQSIDEQIVADQSAESEDNYHVKAERFFSSRSSSFAFSSPEAQIMADTHSANWGTPLSTKSSRDSTETSSLQEFEEILMEERFNIRSITDALRLAQKQSFKGRTMADAKSLYNSPVSVKGSKTSSSLVSPRAISSPPTPLFADKTYHRPSWNALLQRQQGAEKAHRLGRARSSLTTFQAVASSSPISTELSGADNLDGKSGRRRKLAGFFGSPGEGFRQLWLDLIEKKCPRARRSVPNSMVLFVLTAIDTVLSTSVNITLLWFLWVIPCLVLSYLVFLGCCIAFIILFILAYRSFIPQEIISFPVYFNHQPSALMLKQPFVPFTTSANLHLTDHRCDAGENHRHKTVFGEEISTDFPSAEKSQENTIYTTPIPKCFYPISSKDMETAQSAASNDAKSQSSSFSFVTISEAAKLSDSGARDHSTTRHSNVCSCRNYYEDTIPFSCCRRRPWETRQEEDATMPNAEASYDHDGRTPDNFIQRSDHSHQRRCNKKKKKPQQVLSNVAVAFVTFDNRTWDRRNKISGITERERCLYYHKLKTEGREIEAQVVLEAVDADALRMSILPLGFHYDIYLELELVRQQLQSRIMPRYVRTVPPMSSMETRDGFIVYYPHSKDSFYRGANLYYSAPSEEGQHFSVEPTASVIMYSLELFNINCSREVYSSRPFILNQFAARSLFRRALESLQHMWGTTIKISDDRKIPLAESIHISTKLPVYLARIEMSPAVPVQKAALIFEPQLLGFRRFMRANPWLSAICFVSISTLVATPLLSCFVFAIYVHIAHSISRALNLSPGTTRRKSNILLSKPSADDRAHFGATQHSRGSREYLQKRRRPGLRKDMN